MSRYQEIADWYAGLQRYVLSSDRFAPLHGVFAEPLPQTTTITEIRKIHGTAYMRIMATLDNGIIALSRQAIDEYVRQELDTPPAGGDKTPATAAALDTLRDLGHVDLPMVDAAKVADMRAYFEDQQVCPESDPDGQERCTIEQARAGNFGRYAVDTVVGCPHFAELANDPRTLGIVERYLGTVPTILGYCAWWSFAGGNGAKDAQLYHIDGDDYRFCKMFIYLSDVTEENGPHAYIEGSQNTDTIGELRRDWPGGEGEFNDWFFRTLRKTDGQVKRVFGKDPALLTGPAGTSFIADTSGIHKGMLPEKGERLVCQVLYGISPMFQEHFERLEMGTPAARHLPDWLAEPPHRYVNRLFVTPAMAPAL